MLCFTGFPVQRMDGWCVGPGLVTQGCATVKQGKAQLILLSIGEEYTDPGFCDMSHWNLPDPGVELDRHAYIRRKGQADFFRLQGVVRVALDLHGFAPVMGEERPGPNIDEQVAPVATEVVDRILGTISATYGDRPASKKRQEFGGLQITVLPAIFLDFANIGADLIEEVFKAILGQEFEQGLAGG